MVQLKMDSKEQIMVVEEAAVPKTPVIQLLPMVEMAQMDM
ncbi:hypothetical protein P872_00235 [Rhodonellum psychrophilum GCM71 = DSM 17998]|uniref:Uncharacterized protein n=1 Tax=Rhodonellum psychrophilum GCM71 = DSM 17998 TaxID=1123057 RepID=U5C5Q3_9BACT|nr:hypothetical protein P872_00235 [Rhodonellum psychrophilum GCM71 = DSM 17998]